LDEQTLAVKWVNYYSLVKAIATRTGPRRAGRDR
jgi:hypothetical protein